MSKVAITLYGREYFVSCDPGEEGRLKEIVRFVEGRMQKVADRSGTTITDPRLFMLTCLGLADELFELRKNADKNQRDEEDIMVAAVAHLRERVADIASQVGRA